MPRTHQHARVYLPMIALRCSDGAFRVYVAVLAHINRETQETYVSDDTLAEVCGMPKRTVQRHLTELVEAGHLVRGGTTRRRTISATAGANADPIDARIDVNPEPISATAGASPESISAISCIEPPSISANPGALTVEEELTISPPPPACVRAHEADEFTRAAQTIDSMAPGAGLGNLALQFRDQFPTHWYIEAARSAVVKKRLNGPYMLGILRGYLREGGPPEPQAIAPQPAVATEPPRKFETFKQRAKREQRERFRARQAEINRQLDEEEARNAV